MHKPCISCVPRVKDTTCPQRRSFLDLHVAAKSKGQPYTAAFIVPFYTHRTSGYIEENEVARASG